MLSVSNLLVFCLIFVTDICASASTDAGGDVLFVMKLQFLISFSLSCDSNFSFLGCMGVKLHNFNSRGNVGSERGFKVAPSSFIEGGFEKSVIGLSKGVLLSLGNVDEFAAHRFAITTGLKLSDAGVKS